MKQKTAGQSIERAIAKTDFLTNNVKDIESIMTLIAELICPIGVPLPYWSLLEIPTRFVLLDGRALPISDYPELDAVYGPVFGRTATTFNLPDLRGKYLCGLDSSGTGSTLGGSFGAKGMGHYHGMGAGADLNITSSGSHNHNTNISGGSFWVRKAGSGSIDLPTPAGTFDLNESTTANASHTHASSSIAGRIGKVTGGVDGNADLYPPSVAVYYITRYT